MAQPYSFKLPLTPPTTPRPTQWGHSEDRSLLTVQAVQTSSNLHQLVTGSNFQNVLAQMHHISSIPHSVLASKTEISSSNGRIGGPESHESWSRQTSPLGKYVSLSLNRATSMVKIHSIEAGSVNEVPRDVFQRVLHGAYLALNIQHGTIDAFYFVKDDIYAASNDIKTLRRLGPSVNLTSHDSQSNEGVVMMDVKVHLENTVVSKLHNKELFFSYIYLMLNRKNLDVFL